MTWPNAELGEVCAIVNGGTPKTRISEYWGGSFQWITPAEMGKLNSPYVSQTKRQITDLGLKDSSARVLPPMSVILSSRAPIGHLVINAKPMATNQGCKGIVPSDKLHHKFLYYYLTSIRELLDSMGTGATFKELSQGKLQQVRIPLPPFSEQERIIGILDKAFAAIDQAKANTAKSLENAEALLFSFLRSQFCQPSDLSLVKDDYVPKSVQPKSVKRELETTRTGGRLATTRHIPGAFSLSVGMPRTLAKDGWRWRPLADLARLESGHTPSRKHPEYWGGEIPWITLQDARDHHGCTIQATEETINALGISKSAARILPKNTVCLSRTASVGYVVVMGSAMATSQDFVNWVCAAEDLCPEFLKNLIIAETREGLLRFASGAVHQTIYFPEVKAFHVCLPGIKEQRQIAKECNEMREQTNLLRQRSKSKLAELDALKKSLLHHAFNGKL